MPEGGGAGPRGGRLRAHRWILESLGTFRTPSEVYELLREESIGKNGMKGVNGLGATHADLFPSNEVKFG